MFLSAHCHSIVQSVSKWSPVTDDPRSGSRAIQSEGRGPQKAVELGVEPLRAKRCHGAVRTSLEDSLCNALQQEC